jgi:lysophospholipase L1-like esterase
MGILNIDEHVEEHRLMAIRYPTQAVVNDGNHAAKHAAIIPPLRKFSAALAKVRNGQSNAKLLCLGDSTTLGSGSTGVAGYQANGYLKNVPTKLSAALNAVGIPANSNGVFGSGNIGTLAAYATFDPRWSGPSSWAGFDLADGLGRYAWRNNSGTTTLTFTPTVDVDTFQIYVSKSPTATGVDLDINGGAATNYDLYSATSVTGVLTITEVLGSNTLNITRTTTGTNATGSSWVLGVRAYNSAAKQVEVIQSGCAGLKVGDNVSKANPWNARVMLETYLQPDLTLICLGINDWVAQTNLTTWKTNLSNLIASANVTGDVILCTPVPSDDSVRLASIQQTYVDAIIDLAATNGIQYVDLWRRFGSYSAANTLGFFTDTSHPSGAGYQDCVAAEMLMVNSVG